MTFPEECYIQDRSVTEGKTDTELWTERSSPAKCRVLKRTVTVRSENTQHVTGIRTIFMLPKTETVDVRDRIRHGERVYEVIEVVQTRAERRRYHKNAICEGVV